MKYTETREYGPHHDPAQAETYGGHYVLRDEHGNFIAWDKTGAQTEPCSDVAAMLLCSVFRPTPFTATREYGPHHDQRIAATYGGFWVVRDARGNFIDCDKYQNDLRSRYPGLIVKGE